MKAALLSLFIGYSVMSYSQTYHRIKDSTLTLNWSNANLIVNNDDWSGLPSIRGFRGDGLTSSLNVDPRTISADGLSTPTSLLANQNDPDNLTVGGFAEFDGLTNRMLGMQASSVANAPFLLIYLNTEDCEVAAVTFELYDLDGSTDNSQQQVAVQYRVGESGPFKNGSEYFFTLPTFDFWGGYLADASKGPQLSGYRTYTEFGLPAECINQPKVQVRIITTNSSGGNEWIGIDNIVIRPTVLLPFTCKSFSAFLKNNSVVVNWKASCSSSAAFFDVERSEDGLNYKKLSTTQSLGVGEFDYSFTDGTPIKGNSFYRLKMVNIDGKSKYSSVSLVKWSNSEFVLNGILPSFTNSQMTLQISSKSKRIADLYVYDSQGRIVKSQRLNITEGNNNYQLAVDHLASGEYIFQIRTDKEKINGKFIKL
jgi:hypothetical protein